MKKTQLGGVALRVAAAAARAISATWTALVISRPAAQLDRPDARGRPGRGVKIEITING